LALGLVGHDLQGGVESVAAAYDIRLDMHDQPQAFLENVGRCSPDLVLIDSDIINNPCEVCDLLKSRMPLTKVLIVTFFWSEREQALQCCADIIVHRPFRTREWRRAFVSCGLPERTGAIRLASA
jgi:DNA-binding response OmpR family regulator